MPLKFSSNLKLFRFGLVAICGAITACSPSDPKLSYTGIDAPGAIALLDKAQSSHERDIVLDKLKTDRRVGFDWEFFWANLPGDSRFAKLDSIQKERALSLSADSCSVQGFQQFGEFVLKIKEGFAFVTGEKRVCAQPLGAELFAKYVNFFSGKVWTPSSSNVLPVGPGSDVQELARLLITQVQTDARPDKSKILQHLNTDRWYGLIRRLLGIGSGDLAAQLMQINQAQYGSMKFLEQLILSWLNRPAEFAKILSSNALIDVARIMSSDPAFAYVSESIGEAKWMEILNMTSEKFASETAALDAAKLAQAIHTIELLQIIPERAAHPPQFGELLKWHERLLRHLESGLKDDPASALAVNLSSPHAMWMKIRRRNSLTALEESGLADLTSSSKLGQALIQKLKIRTAASREQARERMNAYCSWLDSNEVKSRTLNGDGFQWSMTAEPGCIYLDGNSSPDQTIAAEIAEPVVMAFDSVLYTGGWNLKLNAPSFDGSFLDLTTALKHPDLPEEITPDDDHAVAFPLLMGITIRDNAVMAKGVGTYYFIYHHTWRKARAGRPAEAVPLPGYPGARFELKVAFEGVDPVVTAFGGDGQKGAPRRKGGNASVSKLLWYPLELTLSSAEPDEKGAQPVPVANPSVKTLDLLLKNGEADQNGNLKLLTETERWWNNLEEDQRAKALMACPSGKEDEACWTNLTLAGASALWAEYASLCPVAGAERICPAAKMEDIFTRLNTSYFQEPAGLLGPVNPDGATGADGGLIKEVTP